MSLPDWFWDTEADGSSSPIPVPVGHLSSWSPRNDAKAVHFAMPYGGPVLGKLLPGHFVAQGSFTNTTLHTDNLLKTLHQHQPPKKSSTSSTPS
jgi:hypothetical protein